MLRVAAGEKLAIAQKDVTLTGWAVESRLYAEDPFRNFLPSIGRLVKYRPPAEASQDGITVRNDTGVQEGGEISIHYDPMIAKLVTHAPSRAAAIEAQATALDSFYVDGIRHNIPFLSALMHHPRWREGRLSTGFIAEEFPKGFAVRVPRRRGRTAARCGRRRHRSRARRAQAADLGADGRPHRAARASPCGLARPPGDPAGDRARGRGGRGAFRQC
ncbi:acetyl/propionyl-CoA carboxylase alpha subunit [Bradyrhizobium sp. GM22.5]